MQIIIDSPLGALGRMLDPDGPTMRIAQLSRAELNTLIKAVGILEALRAAWGADDTGAVENHPMDIDVAMAMYTLREIVTDGGRIEV